MLPGWRATSLTGRHTPAAKLAAPLSPCRIQGTETPGCATRAGPPPAPAAAAQTQPRAPLLSGPTPRLCAGPSRVLAFRFLPHVPPRRTHTAAWSARSFTGNRPQLPLAVDLVLFIIIFFWADFRRPDPGTRNSLSPFGPAMAAGPGRPALPAQGGRAAQTARRRMGAAGMPRTNTRRAGLGRPTQPHPAGAAQPPPNLLEATPRCQNRTPGRRGARGGPAQEAAPDWPPARRPRPAAAMAPPLPLPLHGVAPAHSFHAGPARHLRFPLALRRPQHVGPGRRNPVRHPNLPVREARGGRDAEAAPRAVPRPSPLSPPPSRAHHLRHAARPPLPPRGRACLGCGRAGDFPSRLPARLPAGLWRIPRAAPRSRRPFARRPARRLFRAGVGMRPRAPPRPARPRRCPSALGPRLASR